ncbi:hypothetical protein ACHAWF_006743 [Thalassiosira exigua]
MTGVSAEKARQRAEARRLRILAKSAERLDVVSGLAPKAGGAGGRGSADAPSLPTAPASAAAAVVAPGAGSDPAAAVPAPDEGVVEGREPASSPSSVAAAAVEDGATGGAPPPQPELERRPSPEGKGSRRMAAMRRRRYQARSKAREGGEDEGGSPAKEAEGKAEPVADATSKEEAAPAEPSAPPSSAAEKESATTAEDGAEREADGEKENRPVVAPAPSAPAEEEKKRDEEVDDAPKKYVGVARMRRRKVKEQKAQRLRDIRDAEVLGSAHRGGLSGSDLERELAAEVAAMDVTASMVRKGGLVVDESRASLSAALAAKRKRWLRKLIPPARLVPRLVALMLLFAAGLEMGSRPHRSSSSSASERGLQADEVGLIGHVESSLTRPWEYGMGGRVAHLVGAAPSSPPTALPTSFDGSNTCSWEEQAAGECTAEDPAKAANVGSKEDKKKKPKEDKKKKEKKKPRGATTHDDEFADVTGGAAPAPNVDPLLQVDLDAVLLNAALPAPIDYAARVAIGFHRTWTYYLWTLPSGLLRSLWTLPKEAFGGWTSNPPWILGLVLVGRILARVVVGDGRSMLSLDGDPSSSDGTQAGGGGKKDPDVLERVVDMAKNYVKGKFPRATMVLGTTMTLMKVDMYVVLCGMLVGLAGPPVYEDFAAWREGGGKVVEGGPGVGEL